MKLFRMGAVLAVLAGPAFAQEAPHINLLADGPSKTDDEKAADAARDKAYKETLKKIPDAKTSNDPWGGMRADPPKQPAPKAAASSAPRKPKAGTAAN
ncbi:hypothetical protein [Bradyrhizobium guangdongense]|uniref:DUF4148 domain-containing protein n=1 Tax=Bradyrhizobium guangdongense TaxID=1325090 RepID=A0A410V509_9BRAD|nr:hypothetical protein [Bradyrhizobium guangdongense]QAU38801.1 hypothetical protein X265_14810 [Bradyrhizobium guangdongense]QOZ59859.1 hypothetical protein XH86_14815 [Bradyrhizobium guangdongense]GGI23082.1 hypothetical protein GCM10010987_22600 [Bradyrhizobium guangdongense]